MSDYRLTVVIHIFWLKHHYKNKCNTFREEAAPAAAAAAAAAAAYLRTEGTR